MGKSSTQKKKIKEEELINMEAILRIIYISALFLLLAPSIIAQPVVFDITKYGGAPNGDLTSVSIYILKS